MRLFGGTVEGATVGVWCANESVYPLTVAHSGGGMVRAYGATFRNCTVGVRVQDYHRYNSGTVELPNLCYFSDCLFETTEDRPAGLLPEAHLYLSDVSRITVNKCSFRNTATTGFGLQHRGYGIFALDDSFNCKGFSQYDDHYFDGLTAGVVASLPDPAITYTVDGMGFNNNGQGVVDMGSTDARITNNRFVLRGSATPSGQASVGIHLFQSERYTVERNTFTDQGTNVTSVGTWFSGPAFEANRIYDNEFSDLNIGSFVEGRHRADNGVPQTDPGLQLLCGDHINNNADQFVLQEGYLQFSQGLPNNGNVTANNRYESAVSCGTGTGPSYHVGFWAWGDYGLDVRYNYYDNASNPEMRPDCIEDENGGPLSFIGDWFYDLNPVVEGQPFDKEENCKGGVLDEIGSSPGGIVGLVADYSTKQAELYSALVQYKGTVDRKTPALDPTVVGSLLSLGLADDTRLLLGMLGHQPWLPSHELRDTLMAHFPLSDTVMTAMIKRDETMDPWHLTQVLIQNSPLSPVIWRIIQTVEPLPTYFYGLLRQYRNGTSLRSVLEQEIVLRQEERTRLQHLLLDAWAADSTLAGRQDSLIAIFQADSLGDGLRGLYHTHLHRGEFTEATELEDLLEANRHTEQLTVWGKMYQALNGDWHQADGTAQADLTALAMDHASSAGALAWAALLHIGQLDSVPVPEVPAMLKSLWMPRKYRDGAMEDEAVIGVLPNPASDRIAFTYPDDMENGLMEVHDAQGRLVKSVGLNGRKGLVESSVSGLSGGLYTVRLLLDGFNVTSTKFNVIR